MAFAVPGHELDFAIYGDANTNKLQLMPVQVHQLQAQQQQIPARLKGPDLTGYQSGIFDDRSGHRSARERKVKEHKCGSVAFADEVYSSHHANIIPTLQRLSRANTTYRSESNLSRTARDGHERKSSRGTPIWIDTTTATVQPRHTLANESYRRHHKPSQPCMQASSSPSSTTQSGLSAEGRDKWQSCPTFALTPVEDQVDIRDDDAVNADDEGQSESTINKADKVLNNENKINSFTRLSTEETTQSLAVIDHAVTLRPSVARSTSVISNTSSSGRPRLTHRLSYLASVQNMDVDEEEMNHARTSPLNHDARKEKKPSSKSAGELETSSFTLQGHDPASPIQQPPSSSPFPRSTVTKSHGQLAHVKGGKGSEKGPHQRQPSSPQSSSVSTPPIPKLYKRLLRVFNPPTDSSDSDTGMAVHLDVTPEIIYGRGSFGLGPQPTPESIGFNTRRVMAGINPPKPTRKPQILPQVSPTPLPCKDASNKPPEPHMGFKARFLKKLMSSPNLNSNSSIVPKNQTVPHESSRDCASTFSLGYNDSQRVRQDSPMSPIPSDFEHESSCPAGQRIRARREGIRPRASTLPRPPAPMPTLQSKYGVPGRELGAGTQAQVMLLRVKSSKRIRSTQQPSKRVLSSAQATAISPADTERVPTTRLLSPDGNALLMPRAASGTLTTTLEEDVMPEQREAYRKKLLRRTSTGALSAMSISTSGGLIYAIKKFRPPRATETHRQYLKKVCAEFCISTSMDHENIIRTIDLVRDQPGQELVDENHDETTVTTASGNLAHGRTTWGSEKTTRGDKSGNQRTRHLDSTESSSCDNSVPYGDSERLFFKDECLDCNCPAVHRNSGRVRTIRSAGDLRGQTKSLQQRTSAVHKSIAAMPQRKKSIDAYSYNVNGTHHVSEASQGSSQPSMASGKSFQQEQCHPMDWSSKFGLSSNEIKKRKQQQQQLEQEMRLREVQRLKQQKRQEKNQAKQLRLDQFPEYCMVMEFAAGGDLFNLLTKSYPPVSLHEKHCLWRQLVSGIQYMHSMGVAHRDLKPENILIDASGRILKITDFGIANVFKSVGDPNPLPCRGIIGSEPYIAPEEFHQEEYDPRAVDVWACGIIFYVMYYAAMPWARADRKKDGRYARFFNDIMIHRQTEGQRRSQFERQQLYSLRPGTNKQEGGAQYCTNVNGTSSSDLFSSPHYVSHHCQFPPFNSDAHGSSQISRVSNDSSLAGTLTSQLSQGSTDTGLSSVQGSPVEQSATPLSAYNTYGYNQHLGGHEFIDRIETVGCRRVLYSILEPEPKRRLTIDQVANDEWVHRIRYCTDEIVKQEQQAVMHLGKGVPSSKYLTLAIVGQPHHQHAVPKKVRH